VDTTESDFRAALLTAGPVSDVGWYAGGYAGLMMIEDSMSASVSHQQTATPAEFDEAFIAYASSGYGIIFAHGNEYQDAAIRAGQQFPDVTIVVSGGGRVSRNVVPLIFRLEEGSYLAGVAAAYVTESKVVGMVGGVEIPPARGAFLAFKAGVHAVDPEIEVLQVYTGDWDDLAAAKEATVAQLSQGADVIIHNLDNASLAVFQAVREVVSEGRVAYAIGMNSNQNDLAPEVVLGSVVIRIAEAFFTTARMWQDGNVGGAPIYANTEQDMIEFVINPMLLDRLSDEEIERISGTKALIRAGEINVPRVVFVEGEVEGR
jgi:basic membrane lipoprotein Med (substrate-binding protein (PBP1-ABC) superfamily)